MSWSLCPLPCGRRVASERSCRQVNEQLATETLETQVLRTKHSTGVKVHLRDTQRLKRKAVLLGAWPAQLWAASWAAMGSEGGRQRSLREIILPHRENSSNAQREPSRDASAEATGPCDLMLMFMWPDKDSHPGKPWGSSA